jgi:uncharacterized membrane protein YfcA
MSFELFLLLLGFAALGCVSGFMAGLLGLGGGIILVPGLYMIFKAMYGPFPELMHICVGTSLAIISVTSIVSARAHARRGALDQTMFLRMAGGILFGAGMGMAVVGFLPGAALKGIFAGFTLFLSAVLFFDLRFSKLVSERFFSLQHSPLRWQNHLPPVLIGLISSLVGIAGGALSVPAMTQMNMKLHRAVGTAAALGLVGAIPAAAAYIFLGWDVPGRPPLSLGFVNMMAWASAAPFSALIAPLGARLAHYLDAIMLRRIFAGFLFLVALRMGGQLLWP